MEQYISQLSDCQLREGQLRAEREALIRRHERELEELDNRLKAINTLRTQVIEGFKHFLDSPAVLGSGGSADSKTSVLPVTKNPKLLRAESAEATIGAAVAQELTDQQQPSTAANGHHLSSSLLTVDTTVGSQCSTPSPTYHSATHSPNIANIISENAAVSSSKESSPCKEVQVPKSQKGENNPPTAAKPTTTTNNKSGRSFKFVHRLALSKSAGSVPSAMITVASPTTTAIESMLFKVRENVHSLDDRTLNQCIDLLSSRILKDKETRTSVLATPDILGQSNSIGFGSLSGDPQQMVLQKMKKKTEDEEDAKKKQQLSTEVKMVLESGNRNGNEGGKRFNRPAPIRQNAQSESLPTSASASESASPKTPSSPKKRIETAEERRRRIEAVLMQTPASRTSTTSSTFSLRNLGQPGISRSTNSLNEIDLSENNQRSSGGGSGGSGNSNRNHLRPGRFSHRGGNGGNKAAVRRNHSLSPLRFCQRESEERDESLPPSAEFGLVDSDSASVLSADDSAADAENLETDTNEAQGGKGIGGTAGDEAVCDQEVDHLLAPSKVAKSQDLFTKALFPVEESKPLLSREELAKTRQGGGNILLKRKQQTQSLSQESSRGSESPSESSSRGGGGGGGSTSGGGGGSLRVDYLSHLRDHSASPEQRHRERELNAVSNTKKFKTFMNYWENKTTELIDKKKNFDQWHQANSVVDQAPKATATTTTTTVQATSAKPSVEISQPQRQSRALAATSTLSKAKSLDSSQVSSSRQPGKQNRQGGGSSIAQERFSANTSKGSPSSNTFSLQSATSKAATANNNNNNNSSNGLTAAKTAASNVSNSNKLLGANSPVQAKVAERRPTTEKRSAVVIQAAAAAKQPNNSKEPVSTKLVKESSSTEKPKVNQQQRDNNIENDQLMQRLRHIQQDIRQRRGIGGGGGGSGKQAQTNSSGVNAEPSPANSSSPLLQQGPVFSHQKPGRLQQTATCSSFNAVSPRTSQPQPAATPATSSRPSIQAAKSLDLQYYPMKQQQPQNQSSVSVFPQQQQQQQQPKSAAVRVLQSNEQPPGTKTNRLRLIRSTSSNESAVVDAVAEQQPQPVMKSQLANTPNTVVTVRPGPRTAAMAASNGHRHTVDGSAAIGNALVGGVGSSDSGMTTAFKPILSSASSGHHHHPLHHLSMDVTAATPMRSTYF